MSQSKMSVTDDTEKKFVVKHVFKDVKNLEKNKLHFGATEFHHNIPWKIGLYIGTTTIRTKKYTASWLHLVCDKSHGKENWSVATTIIQKVSKAMGAVDTFSEEHIFEQEEEDPTSNMYIKKLQGGEINKYIVDGDLTLEYEVKIEKMEGIKEKLINFDKESAEKFSDVVLIVGGEKFYVLKKYLSFHSTYFASLLFGNFAESGKSEIELKDINSWDLQNFLEVLYGEPAIDDETVEGILQLADFFDSKTVVRKCQDFLLKKSRLPLKRKFEAAIKGNMEDVKRKCFSEMKTKKDVKSVIPQDPHQIDQSVWAELFEKLAAFK